MPSATVALELVPTNKEGGKLQAIEEVRKLKALEQKWGLLPQINAVLVPQVIPEEEDRPLPLKEKMGQLQFTRIVSREFRGVSFILTMVTVFTPRQKLEERLQRLKEIGVQKVVFVGVPRSLGDRKVIGPFPSEAISLFSNIMPSRGVILIPTRAQEKERFIQKVKSGATFGLSQMLFSDKVVRFLQELSGQQQRPEIILSFGYVPKAELKTGFIQWLIRDPTAADQEEIRVAQEMAGLPFHDKKARMVELYQRILEGVGGLGFPLSLHLECPYGISEPALECFAALTDVAKKR